MLDLAWAAKFVSGKVQYCDSLSLVHGNNMEPVQYSQVGDTAS